ncbi:MAG TPA: tyrosine-type recombinase/integrase [Thermoanaerobaculia bacterium]|nr:tyrosine-type recombinase/integrase [Thermoanaerobaculia bacterium]
MSKPAGNRKNPREIQAFGGAEKWPDDQAILDGWTSFLVSVRGRGEGTAQRYRRLVERLLADVGKPFAQLGREDVEKHLRRLHVAGRGESVRQGVVVAVRSLGEWCLAHGIVEVNPGGSLCGPSGFRREVRPLTVEEVSRLIWGDRSGSLPAGHRELRNRALLAVMYIAGLRASEPGPIRVNDVQWDEGAGVFRLLLVKSKAARRERWVPLDRRVSQVLGAYLAVRPAGSPWLFASERGTPLSRAAVYQIFRRRRREAGIEARGRRMSPHILRHSIATHLLARGWDIRTVQVHMRHASIKTTEVYLHADEGRVQRMMVRSSPLGERGRGGRGEVGGSVGRGLVEMLGELGGEWGKA